ncbi:hypothetical protein HQ590_11485 [bacterium]|nr:hypothetical protein [bacterium]
MIRVFLLFLFVWAGAPLLADPVRTNPPVQALGGTRSSGRSGVIFDDLARPADVRHGAGLFVARTVARCRTNALARGRSANATANLAGRWLEWSVLVALRERQLTPAWWQAELAAVPGSCQDILLWSGVHGPIVISCKTSLRERYKQAELEASRLRRKYPEARCYLVTLDQDKRHVARIRQKIATGELLALRAVYDETDLGELIDLLACENLVEAPANALRRATVVR